jgi:hypothetical protein
MNNNKSLNEHTKKPLAFKSIPQIIWTAVTMFIAIVVGYAVMEFYGFDFSQMPEQIIFISVASMIIVVALSIFLVYLLTNPHVLMYQDENGIYVIKRKEEIFISYKDIQKVHTTISIWAKPFLVYTSLVITLEDHSVTIRNIHDMADIRDQIIHKVFKA